MVPHSVCAFHVPVVTECKSHQMYGVFRSMVVILSSYCIRNLYLILNVKQEIDNSYAGNRLLSLLRSPVVLFSGCPLYMDNSAA